MKREVEVIDNNCMDIKKNINVINSKIASIQNNEELIMLKGRLDLLDTDIKCLQAKHENNAVLNEMVLKIQKDIEDLKQGSKLSGSIVDIEGKYDDVADKAFMEDCICIEASDNQNKIVEKEGQEPQYNLEVSDIETNSHSKADVLSDSNEPNRSLSSSIVDDIKKSNRGGKRYSNSETLKKLIGQRVNSYLNRLPNGDELDAEVMRDNVLKRLENRKKQQQE